MSNKPNEITANTKASMKTRIVTALLALLAIIPVLFIGDWIWLGFVVILTLIANYEIINCAKKNYSLWLYIVSFIFQAIITFWPIFTEIITNNIGDLQHIYNLTQPLELNLPVGVLISGLSILFLMVLADEHFTVTDAFGVFTLVILIALGMQGLCYLRYIPSQIIPNWAVDLKAQSSGYMNWFDNFASVSLIVYVALGIFFTDIGAYFIGLFFGKRKINPRISPNKTIGGFFGGIVVSFITSMAFAFILALIKKPMLDMFDLDHWYNIVILSLIMPLFASLGDFVFSSVKRWYKIKDFGTILPGHGGLLDRIDSITFVAIVASVYVQYMSGI